LLGDLIQDTELMGPLMSNLLWLTDAQMDRLRPFFPKSHSVPRADDRGVVSGIVVFNRNGLRWSDAPKKYGPPKSLYNRWKRWGGKGIFARMMEGLASEAPGSPLCQGGCPATSRLSPPA